MSIENQIEQGVQNMKQIIGNETYELLQNSTPLKLFFSMISPTPLDEGKNVANAVTARFQDVAVVGANGFVFGDKIYPFTSEYQSLIHRKMIESLIQNPSFAKDVINSFISFSSEWSELFLALQTERFQNRITKVHKQRIDQLMIDTMNKFDMNTDFNLKKLYFTETYPALSSTEVDSLIKDVDRYTKARESMRHEETKKRREIISGKYAEKAREIQGKSDDEVKRLNGLISDIEKKHRAAIAEHVKEPEAQISRIEKRLRAILEQKIAAIPLDLMETDKKLYDSMVEEERKQHRKELGAARKPHRNEIERWTAYYTDRTRIERDPYKKSVRDEKARCKAVLKKERIVRDGLMATMRREVEAMIINHDIAFEADMRQKYNISILYDRIKCDMQRHHGEHFVNYLIEKGFLTASEITEYDTFSDDCNAIIQNLAQMAIVKANETGSQIVNISHDFRKYDAIPMMTNARHGSITLIREVLNGVKSAIKVAAGIKYFDEYDYNSDRAYQLNYDVFFPKSESAYKRDEMLEYQQRLERNNDNFEKLMKILLRDEMTPEAAQLFQDYIALCTHYFNDLYIPYRQGKLVYGGVSGRERLRIRRQVDKISQRLENRRDVIVQRETDNRFDLLLNSLCEHLLGVSKTESSNIIMLPTGFILVDTNKGIAIKGFHPLDPAVKSIMNKNTWDDWMMSWEQFWRKISKIEYRGKFEFIDETIRSVINMHLDEMMMGVENPSPVETHVKKLQQDYTFETSSLIKKTGLFNYGFSEYNLQLLDELLPIFGGWIHAINVIDFSMNPDELPEKIQMFVFTGNDFIGLMVGKSNKLTLNLSVSMSTMDIDMDTFAHVVAIKVYQMMDQDMMSKFHEVVDGRLNVSKMELYRATGKRMDSPLDRRQCMSRFLFVSEFVKYLVSPEESPDTVRFFKFLLEPLMKKQQIF